jgi:coenzyme F420-reducing hydrogenase beta subunit
MEQKFSYPMSNGGVIETPCSIMIREIEAKIQTIRSTHSQEQVIHETSISEFEQLLEKVQEMQSTYEKSLFAAIYQEGRYDQWHNPVPTDELEQRVIADSEEFVEETFVGFEVIQRKQFVQQVSELDAGMLTQIAKNALEENRIDECIQMWLEQDADPGSRKKVQEVLGQELYDVLQSFKAKQDE